MAKPATAILIGISVNNHLCRARSEKNAINIENPKLTAQGGTECSCVWIGLYPYDLMMVGAK